jgi:hypothetical protein
MLHACQQRPPSQMYALLLYVVCILVLCVRISVCDKTAFNYICISKNITIFLHHTA